MREAFKKYLNQLVQLTEEEINLLEKIMTSRKLRKKEKFIDIDKVCSSALFFKEGYFRFYHLDSDGTEITSDFYFAPGFITSYTSFITGNPSSVIVQAMVDMEVLEFQKRDLYGLYSRYPNIERMGRIIAEIVAITSEEHLFMILKQSAEMRYKRLLERNPAYVNTIPLQYIASYLGITQETLSRIRKSIK